MIRTIPRIKGLGVYGNYEKPQDMQDFGVKNLIYGWNYSGKTTLSRLFAQLETGIANPDLSGCTFTIDTDSAQITQANFHETQLTVRVFNSDFVRDNLNFTGQSFKPILLLGKETEDAQRRLDHCEDLYKRIQEKISLMSRQLGDLESMHSSAKTSTAARIKKTLSLVEAYTAAHLGGDLAKVAAMMDSQILSEEDLRHKLRLSLTSESERPVSVELVSITPSISALHTIASDVLATTPSLASTIKHLEENPQIERWIETGMQLHTSTEKCEFCGGDVTIHRITALRAHFSKDLAEHKENVAQLLEKVRAAKIAVQLPGEAEFNPQFREKYRESVLPLEKAIAIINNAVDVLASDVQSKIEAPFKASQPSALPPNLEHSLATVLSSINQVIEANNKIASDFTSAKADAIRSIKYHYTQELIDDQLRTGREAKEGRLKRWSEKYNNFQREVALEANRLRAIISQAQLGREEINARLISFLGDEAVQITVVPDSGQERFQLVRKDGKPAKNLSDGEKTAIAFTYFLTKLKELNVEKFKQTIVYIDDPISSLDANHIFQVTAAIKEVFFGKNEGNEWSTKCRQFFLSTHSFQFFDLIRELDPKKSPRARLYFVRKVNPQQSVLGNMPLSLCKYSSEYHFLFETIYRFNNSPDKSSHELLILLPNAFRRFVELYTFARIPSSNEITVDRRAEILFGNESSKRILKVLHFFSHANSFDRLIGNSELIFDMEHAVGELLSSIQVNDPHHWSALVQALEGI